MPSPIRVILEEEKKNKYNYGCNIIVSRVFYIHVFFDQYCICANNACIYECLYECTHKLTCNIILCDAYPVGTPTTQEATIPDVSNADERIAYMVVNIGGTIAPTTDISLVFVSSQFKLPHPLQATVREGYEKHPGNIPVTK